MNLLFITYSNLKIKFAFLDIAKNKFINIGDLHYQYHLLTRNNLTWKL